MHINAKKKENNKLALNSGIKTYQIMKNDDEVCIPNLSSILLAVLGQKKVKQQNIISTQFQNIHESYVKILISLVKFPFCKKFHLKKLNFFHGGRAARTK